MNVCFNGYDEKVATFEARGLLSKGQPVMITSSGAVSAASGSFCGVCTGVRNGYAGVQLSGYVRLPYLIAPDVGYSKISVSGGKVSADSENGREYLIADIDTVNQTVGIIL